MNPLELAQHHLETLVKLADTGQIKWHEEAPPRPEAMRAFSASTPDYQIMVCQANVHHDNPAPGAHAGSEQEGAHGFEFEARVIHEGMAIAISGAGMSC